MNLRISCCSSHAMVGHLFELVFLVWYCDLSRRYACCGKLSWSLSFAESFSNWESSKIPPSRFRCNFFQFFYFLNFFIGFKQKLIVLFVYRIINSFPSNNHLIYLIQFSKYHRGGFEPKMSRKEAAMILGIPLNAKPNKIKEAHKRIMIANHPDRGSYFIIIVFLTQFFVFKVFYGFFFFRNSIR